MEPCTNPLHTVTKPGEGNLNLRAVSSSPNTRGKHSTPSYNLHFSYLSFLPLFDTIYTQISVLGLQLQRRLPVFHYNTCDLSQSVILNALLSTSSYHLHNNKYLLNVGLYEKSQHGRLKSLRLYGSSLVAPGVGWDLPRLPQVSGCCGGCLGWQRAAVGDSAEVVGLLLNKWAWRMWSQLLRNHTLQPPEQSLFLGTSQSIVDLGIQEEEYGFRPGRGTVDRLCTLHGVLEDLQAHPGRQFAAECEAAGRRISISQFGSQPKKGGLSGLKEVPVTGVGCSLRDRVRRSAKVAQASATEAPIASCSRNVQPGGDPRTRWTDCHAAGLGSPWTPPGRAGGKVPRESEAWVALLRLLPLQPTTGKAEADGASESLNSRASAFGFLSLYFNTYVHTFVS